MEGLLLARERVHKACDIVTYDFVATKSYVTMPIVANNCDIVTF